MAHATTQLVLAQTTGPLEVVQLSTGITVAEAAPGEQVLRLTLPPGPYLVRRLTGGEVRSKEVQVKANESTRLEEASLTLVGSTFMPAKGPGPVDVRGKHQLGLGGGVAPLDAGLSAFTFGVPVSVDYSFFFLPKFGWRVLDATWLFTTQRGLTAQLGTDFGVLPTTFRTVEWAAHTGLTWEPTLIDNGVTEVRGALCLGAGAIGLQQGTSADAATARRGGAPSVVLSAELLWMFAASAGLGGLGARVGITEQLGFASFGQVHLLTLNLAIVGTVGPTR
jgi:hypothetical protein